MLKNFSVFWFFLLICVFYTVSEVKGKSFTVLHHYAVSDIDSSVEGVILKLEKKYEGYDGAFDNACINYDIQYEYSVSGEKYKSSLVSYELIGCSGTDIVLNRYKVGQTVTTFYDSKKPQYSYLEKVGFPSEQALYILGLSILSFLLALVIGKSTSKI